MMRPQFRVQISPADTGKRVTVRYRLREAGEGPPYSDVVGVLRAWEGGVLRIENRKGETVALPEDDLVAGRVVQAPPTRTS